MRIPDGKLPMFFNASSRIFEYAKQLRGEKSTKAERVLWEKLKAKKLDGHKFRFQHPIGKFIADFYCNKKKLIIEIDGGYHFEKEQEELDAARTAWLEMRGIKVIRFTNEDVMKNLDEVLVKIQVILEEIETKE